MDEACNEHLGFKGVFRLPLRGQRAEPELLDKHRNPRPNGIAFSPDYSHLYVSNCCQGSHLPGCTQGTVIYNIYRMSRGRPSFLRSIKFEIDGEQGSRGCADGFKVHGATGYIVGSCPTGICIVDAGVREGAARKPKGTRSSEGMESQAPRHAGSSLGSANGGDAFAEQAPKVEEIESTGDSVDKASLPETAEGEGGKTAEDSQAMTGDSEEGSPSSSGGMLAEAATISPEVLLQTHAEAPGRPPSMKRDAEHVALLARLNLGHKVSNVLFADDGFLYATGESAQGGGALMRIPLKHPQSSVSGSVARDELRR